MEAIGKQSKERNIMPTSPIMKLPKSSSSKEFENMCRDVLKMKYGMDFDFYGRTGQKQYGIDLYAKSKNDSYIVVQCKNYYKSTFEKFCSQISEDIKSSNSLGFIIEKFIVMTALDRDVKIQNFISGYNKAPFPVMVLFWNDIEYELCNNEKLLKKYYQNIYNIYDDEIPIEDRNDIILNANVIKKAVKNIYERYSSYNPGYCEKEDRIILNICIDIYRAVLNLIEKKDKYYLQLEKLKLIRAIDQLDNELPEFYYDNQDYTGSSMVCTIFDYKVYFSNNENVKRYEKWCNKIIKKIKNYEF